MSLSGIHNLLHQVELAVQANKFWSDHLQELRSEVHEEQSPRSVHLGIFVEPYLRYILDGRKTIESRFSVKRTPPYMSVAKGDILLLKRSGGPIVGICQVNNTWFYELDPESWSTIRTKYTAALCAQDPEFWTQRQAASFASLMRITDVMAIDPIAITKKDRRGWVILHDVHHPSKVLPF